MYILKYIYIYIYIVATQEAQYGPKGDHMVQKIRPEGSKNQIYQTRLFDRSEFVNKLVPKKANN